MLVPLGVGEAGGQGVLAGDFFFVVVGDRRAFVDLAEPVDRAGIEQQGRDELCLAGAAVADERDVSQSWRRRRPSWEVASEAASVRFQLPARIDSALELAIRPLAFV